MIKLRLSHAFKKGLIVTITPSQDVIAQVKLFDYQANSLHPYRVNIQTSRTI